MSSFVTRRFRNSQLAYINNRSLESRVLGSLGKYLDKYKTRIYAFTLFGSHDHSMYEFKEKTKSKFFRDFGARTAEAVKTHVPDFGTGAVFEKRPSEQAITEDKESHLDRLMYTILQPIRAGLCKNLSDYPGFNSFKYILSGKPLEVEFFNSSAYRRAKRRKKDVDPSLFVEKYSVRFEKIPGYEHLSQREYARVIQEEYERRRIAIIEEFEAKGHIWPSVQSLRRTRCTECARSPKRAKKGQRVPLVLSLCVERKKQFLEFYFSTLIEFKKASQAYLLGNRNAVFPSGTCIPPGPWC
ncbi:MAG: hypothetical protein KDC47_08325 [Flavobacteriaceae bacterium]|nr:hypothetical protein [Flavobacteriaceae bacterium]